MLSEKIFVDFYAFRSVEEGKKGKKAGKKELRKKKKTERGE